MGYSCAVHPVRWAFVNDSVRLFSTKTFSSVDVDVHSYNIFSIITDKQDVSFDYLACYAEKNGINRDDLTALLDFLQEKQFIEKNNKMQQEEGREN